MTIDITEFEGEEQRYLGYEEMRAILENDRRWALVYDIETKPAEMKVLKDFFDESSVHATEAPWEVRPQEG